MASWEGAMSALGGLSAVAGLIWVVMRATAGRVRAIDENTAATKDLTTQIRDLAATVNGHETRISRLEGYRPRPRATRAP